MTKTFLLRFRKKDTPISIAMDTLDKLARNKDLSKSEIIHKALKEYADKVYAREKKAKAREISMQAQSGYWYNKSQEEVTQNDATL